MAFPEVTIKTHYKSTPYCPWMTPGLLVSQAKKEKLFFKKHQKHSADNTNNFKKYNLLYNKVCRNAKRSFYNHKFNEFSSNRHKTWDTIREVIKTKKGGRISLTILCTMVKLFWVLMK